MDSFYNFANNSPFLTLILVLAVSSSMQAIVCRGYRAVMVLVRGWPPGHIDADGDWKPAPKPEETK